MESIGKICSLSTLRFRSKLHYTTLVKEHFKCFILGLHEGQTVSHFMCLLDKLVLRGRALWLSLHIKNNYFVWEFEGPKVFPIQMRNSI